MDIGFTSIPNKLLASEKLTGYEKLILIVLISYRMKNDFCFPSRKKISHDTGFNIKTVDRVLKILKEKNFIRVEKNQGRKNQYFLSEILNVSLKEK